MRQNQQNVAVEVNRDLVDISLEATRLLPPHNRDMVGSPGKFWAHRVWDTWSAGGGDEEERNAMVDSVALSIRLLATDALAGNTGRVGETLVGQAAWLSALAVRLEHQAWTEPYSPSNQDRQIKLIRLAIQAQRQAAQTLYSVAALNKDGVQAGD
jgi:hypothetical protein